MRRTHTSFPSQNQPGTSSITSTCAQSLWYVMAIAKCEDLTLILREELYQLSLMIAEDGFDVAADEEEVDERGAVS